MCRTCKGLLCVVPVMLVLGCAASEKGTSNGAAEVVQHMDALDTELSAHSMHIAPTRRTWERLGTKRGAMSNTSMATWMR